MTPGVAVVVIRELVRYAWGLLRVVHRICGRSEQGRGEWWSAKHRYRRTIQRAGVCDRRRQRRAQPLFPLLHAPNRGNIADSAHRIPPSEFKLVWFWFVFCYLKKSGTRNPFLKLDGTAHIKCEHHLLKLVWNCDILSSGHLYPKTANTTWTHKHRDHILIATCNRDGSNFQLSGHSDIRPRTR